MITDYKIKLRVLSPIHIGCGECYDPTQFKFDENGDMIVFNTIDFLDALDTRKSEEFCKLCSESRNSIPIFRFFRDNFKDTIKHRVIKASSDLFNRYKQICNSGSISSNVINQFELKRTIYNPMTQQAYIPGSSLKGCLKTIWMSGVAESQKIRVATRPILNLEDKVLMGNFENDPFRFVKISDLHSASGKVETQLIYAVNVPKRPEKEGKSNLTVPFEVILKGNVFEGTISIDDRTFIPESKRPKRKPVDFPQLHACAKLHYYSEEILSNEEQMLKKIRGSTRHIDDIRSEFSKMAFPIRIGHHSGAEFITISNNCDIKIMQGRGKSRYSDKTTTTWFASSYIKRQPDKLLPSFGWAMLEFEEMS